MITSIEQLDFDGTYSYAEYATWKFEQFVELFKGRLMPMPAPSRNHQRITTHLLTEINLFLKKNSCGCEVYPAPFDVRLVKNPLGKTDKEIYTVVQPDICVVCDLSKLDARGCIGAPEWIIEIVSESNPGRDVKDKFMLYEENGVGEYWIARPSERTIQIFLLENDQYVYKGTFTYEDSISPFTLSELRIPLESIFVS